MKVTVTKIEKTKLLSREEIGRLLNLSEEVSAAFKGRAAEVTFNRSYTSDQPKPSFKGVPFATLSRQDIAQDTVTTVELSLREVKAIVARAREAKPSHFIESFDCKETGDGDGSKLHEFEGFRYKVKFQTAACGD